MHRILTDAEGYRRIIQEGQEDALNLGELSGFGGIGLGLTALLVALLWSATRRLRNLPDDPRIIRASIVAGLALAAFGVVIATLTRSSF